MYFTVAELRMLMCRRQLQTAQADLSYARRRYPSVIPQAENGVKVALLRLWAAQQDVDSNRLSRLAHKEHVLDMISA